MKTMRAPNSGAMSNMKPVVVANHSMLASPPMYTNSGPTVGFRRQKVSLRRYFWEKTREELGVKVKWSSSCRKYCAVNGFAAVAYPLLELAASCRRVEIPAGKEGG